MPNKFEKLEKFQTVRSKLAVCPIIKQKVMVSPLTVGDDLHVRTMIANPEMYDSEISLMIFNHSNFVDFSEITYTDFINNISHSDRKMLLWAVYVATYAVIKDADITCPECGFGFKENIDVDNLLTSDTVTVWDKEVPFSEFEIVHEHSIDEKTKLIFHLKLPTIGQHLSLLKTITAEQIQENFKRFESILSRVDELILCVSSIELVDDGTDTFNDMNEIRVVLDKYVPIEVQDDIIKTYDTIFDPFDPKFTHFCTCSDCGNKFHFDIDIETVLFKRFLNT